MKMFGTIIGSQWKCDNWTCRQQNNQATYSTTNIGRLTT